MLFGFRLGLLAIHDHLVTFPQHPNPFKTNLMKPKPVEPKRADFSSFDDYFHAMIQYYLELSRQHLKDVKSFSASINSSNQSVSKKEEHPVCKTCTNSFECSLLKFSPAHRERVCLILPGQVQTLKSPHLYTSGKVLLPEERNLWHKRLKSFMQERLQ